MNKIRRWFADLVIDIVLKEISVGGNCGCCGNWVEYDLVPSYWRVTICKECIEGANNAKL